VPLEQYILRGHTPVRCDDTLEWGQWFHSANRVVRQEEAFPGVQVSTVFLGMSHQFGNGPPLLFETMIFGGPLHDYQDRCSTWDEAVQMHERAKNLAIQEGPGDPPKEEPLPPTWYDRVREDD
jgi:hypothetical protein